jgi:hypothetical protein
MNHANCNNQSAQQTDINSRKSAFTPLNMPRQTVEGTATAAAGTFSALEPRHSFAHYANEKENRERMRCLHLYNVHRSFDRPITGGSVLVPEIALNAAVSFCLNRCF